MVVKQAGRRLRASRISRLVRIRTVRGRASIARAAAVNDEATGALVRMQTLAALAAWQPSEHIRPS